MLEPTEIEVNGRKYVVNPMSPSDAIDFVFGFQAAKEKGDSIAPFINKAIGHCLDSSLKPLNKSENFQKCFSDYPEDLIVLGPLALEEIISPFLSRQIDTMKEEKNYSRTSKPARG